MKEIELLCALTEQRNEVITRTNWWEGAAARLSFVGEIREFGNGEADAYALWANNSKGEQRADRYEKAKPNALKGN